MKFSELAFWFFIIVATIGVALAFVIGLGGTFVSIFSCLTGITVKKLLEKEEATL